VAGGFLEGANFCGEGGSGGINGMRFFDFGDEGGADDGGVGEAAEKGDVSGQRNFQSPPRSEDV